MAMSSDDDDDVIVPCWQQSPSILLRDQVRRATPHTKDESTRLHILQIQIFKCGSQYVADKRTTARLVLFTRFYLRTCRRTALTTAFIGENCVLRRRS